jgi:hypothetical protein
MYHSTCFALLVALTRARAAKPPVMDTLAFRKEINDMSAKASLLFSTGHIHEASLMWHGVVRRLLPLVTADAAEPGADDDATAPSLAGAFWVHPPLEMSSWAHSTMITSGDRTFAVYASAIQYVAHPSCEKRSGDDDLALAATAVFNLGLFHHLQALLHGDRATRCYEKALRAYGAAQRILDESGLSCRVCPSQPSTERDEQHQHQQRGLLLLHLALVNNVGHICDQIHSHDDVQRQLETLHSLVASLDRATALSPAAPTLLGETETFLPFLLTATLRPLHSKARCHAPSA